MARGSFSWIKKYIPFWFILFIIIYLINQITDKNSKIDFLNYYLNDFLAVPIVLQLVLISFQLLYKNVNIYLGKDKILYTVIYISFFFELLLPYFSERFVGDWLDVIMYCLGGLAFFLFQKNSK
jgi:hypothetical protein